MGVGHCLACPVFHVGHEQHSPNERFEKLVILCLSAISVLAFALGGFVHWPEAIVMAIAATIGGYAGAPIAGPAPIRVRLIVIAVGFGMSAIFFARQFCEIGNAHAKLRQAGLTRSHRPDNNTSR